MNKQITLRPLPPKEVETGDKLANALAESLRKSGERVTIEEINPLRTRIVCGHGEAAISTDFFGDDRERAGSSFWATDLSKAWFRTALADVFICTENELMEGLIQGQLASPWRIGEYPVSVKFNSPFPEELVARSSDLAHHVTDRIGHGKLVEYFQRTFREITGDDYRISNAYTLVIVPLTTDAFLSQLENSPDYKALVQKCRTKLEEMLNKAENDMPSFLMDVSAS